MQINRNKHTKCMFADLVTGDCFIYGDVLFIKVSSISGELNAFNCEGDVLIAFANSTLVTPINIELQEV